MDRGSAGLPPREGVLAKGACSEWMYTSFMPGAAWRLLTVFRFEAHSGHVFEFVSGDLGGAKLPEGVPVLVTIAAEGGSELALEVEGGDTRRCHKGWWCGHSVLRGRPPSSVRSGCASTY